MEPSEVLRARPEWQQTGDNYFPAAAMVAGKWWVLRLNSFPDHPLWTLFVGGQVQFDIDDAPKSWGGVASGSSPVLPPDDSRAALDPVRRWRAYGSEVGRPCDNPFCCAE